MKKILNQALLPILLASQLFVHCKTSKDEPPPIPLPEGSHLIVYFNGPVKDGSPFISENFGHPGVRYVVKEGDGSFTHFFLDVGVREEYFVHNRRLDLESLRIPDREKKADFIVFSHTHPLFLPSAFLEDSKRRPELRRTGFHEVLRGPFSYNDGGGIGPLLEENPDLRIYVPELKNFTYRMLPPVWRKEGLLERAIQLKEGYTRVTERVGIVTTPFDEAEKDYARWLGYDIAYENLVVVSTEEGYLVHAACSHIPAFKINGRVPHPVEAIKKYMPDPLPERPVSFILTGGCNFYDIARKNGIEPMEAHKYVYSMLLGTTFPDLKGVMPIHCGLGTYTFCHEVFGGKCLRGDPGEVLDITD